MFKAGDKVTVVRLQSTVRPTTIHEQAQDHLLGDFTTEKPKMVETKATIGQLGRVFIPVVMPDGGVHQKPYPDLTFGKDNKVSWEAKKADCIKVVDHVEVKTEGKAFTAKGVIDPSFKNYHIPVILNGDVVMIPLNQLVFKEKR